MALRPISDLKTSCHYVMQKHVLVKLCVNTDKTPIGNPWAMSIGTKFNFTLQKRLNTLTLEAGLTVHD